MVSDYAIDLLVEATTDLLKKFRVTPEGKATFAVVQAEDELAAIGMVLGAGWAGARSMTRLQDRESR